MTATLPVLLRDLQVAWQPIIEALPGRGVAHEALLRIGDGSTHGPLDALALAAQEGRVEELERAMHRAIAGQLGELAGDNVVFVNLHPSTLSEDWLYEAAAPLARLAPRVVFEIPEAMIPMPERTLARRIRQLRAMGYRIAMDDVGVRHSTLDRARRLRPEFLKLDRTVITKEYSVCGRPQFVERVVDLARHQGARVVAEGIEYVDDLTRLRSLGVQGFQGYLFARPAVAELSSLIPPSERFAS